MDGTAGTHLHEYTYTATIFGVWQIQTFDICDPEVSAKLVYYPKFNTIIGNTYNSYLITRFTMIHISYTMKIFFLCPYS